MGTTTSPRQLRVGDTLIFEGHGSIWLYTVLKVGVPASDGSGTGYQLEVRRSSRPGQDGLLLWYTFPNHSGIRSAHPFEVVTLV